MSCDGDPTIAPITLEEPETWIEAITPWLLAGGDPSVIPLPAPGMDAAIGWMDLNNAIDLNGDGIDDLLLLIGYPREDQITPRGALQVYVCEGGSYRLEYQIHSTQDWSGPEIHYVGDLNNDEIEDLVITQRRCGAHTCFLLPEVLTWDGSLQNRLTFSIGELPNPVLEVVGLDPASVEIHLTVLGPGSAGAGPFRPYTLVFSWEEQGKEFPLQREEQTPAIYRIHVLEEAEQAVVSGDLPRAEALFAQVIEDSELDDWLHGDAGRNALAGLAYYRMIQLQLMSGDNNGAAGTLAALESESQENRTIQLFQQLGQDLWDITIHGGSMPEACRSARELFKSLDDEFFRPFDYGYSNPTLEPTVFCPY